MNRAKLYLKRKSHDSAIKLQENPVKAFLQYSALPLTLGTALLYLLGWIYSTSYLAAWGLPIGLFPLTKDQSLITGFFHALLLLANSISFISKVIVLLMVIMVATMISCCKPIHTWLIYCVSNIPNPRKWRVGYVYTPTHDSIIGKIAFLTGGIAWIFLAVIFAALLCGWVDKQAKGRAVKERMAIITGQASVRLPARVVLHIKSDDRVFSIYSGHLIDNSMTHAALYTGRNGMLILPMSQVARIEVRDSNVATK